MPLYEFTCPGCGRSFEELVRSANDTAAVKCLTCGSHNVRRKISMFASRASGAGLSFSAAGASSCAPTGG
ncbi:MAG: zinc ribbon domain-containing protein [Chloroflexi bacterium]|nr:zinc ribbon domain-containing protein [Chloroflexota bacterium]